MTDYLDKNCGLSRATLEMLVFEKRIFTVDELAKKFSDKENFLDFSYFEKCEITDLLYRTGHIGRQRILELPPASPASSDLVIFLRSLGLKYTDEVLELCIDELSEKMDLSMPLAEELHQLKDWLLQRPILSAQSEDRTEKNNSEKQLVSVQELHRVSENFKTTLVDMGIRSLQDILELDIREAARNSNVGGALIKEIRSVKADPDSFLEQSVQPPVTQASTLTERQLSTLIADLDSVPVKLAQKLKSQDVTLVSELLSLDSNEFSRWSGVGTESSNWFESVLLDPALLFRSITQNANSHVASTVESSSSLYVPSDFDESVGAIEGSRIAFDAFCYAISERDAAILKGRVWTSKGVRTLESLATQFEITRERVRQLEGKILKKLVAFFCKRSFVVDQKVNRSIALHPDLAIKWKNIADVLVKFEQVDTRVFFEVLQEGFGARPSDLTQIIHFSSCIFTQKVMNEIAADYKSHGQWQLWLKNLNGVQQKAPLAKLRLGKLNRKLEQKFSATALGDLDGVLDLLPIQQTARLGETIRLVIESSRNGQEVDWKTFCELKNYPLMSSTKATSDSEMIQKIRWMIRYVCSWRDAEAVFDLRTARAAHKRLTLAQVSTRVLGKDSLGPVIARTESTLIEKLGNVLCHGDYSQCSCWVSDDLVELFSHSKKIYNDAADFFDFRGKFEKTVDLNFDSADLPYLIWALFDGYPPERYHHLKKRNSRKTTESEDEGVPVIPKKIVLRGFRRVF